MLAGWALCKYHHQQKECVVEWTVASYDGFVGEQDGTRDACKYGKLSCVQSSEPL